MPESRQKEIMEKMNELRNQHSLNDELSAEIYKQTQRADQCELENEQLREEICRLRSKTENLNREKAFIADSCEQTVMEIRSKLESVRQELINTEHQFEEERLIREELEKAEETLRHSLSQKEEDFQTTLSEIHETHVPIKEFKELQKSFDQLQNEFEILNVNYLDSTLELDDLKDEIAKLKKDKSLRKILQNENKTLKTQLEELIWSNENQLREKQQQMDEKIATLEILLEESQHENERLSEELLDIRDFEIERTLSTELGGINEQNQDNFDIVEQELDDFLPEEFRKILSRRVSEFETRIFENNEKLASLMEENEILKTTRNRAKTEQQALPSDISLTTQLNLFRDLLEQKEGELVNLENQLQKSENEKNFLQEISATRLNSQLTLFRELLEEKEHEIESKNVELNQMTERFEKMSETIKSLESSLSSNKIAVAELYEKALGMENLQIKMSEEEFLKRKILEKQILEKELTSAKLKDENFSIAKALESAQEQSRQIAEKLECSEKSLRGIKEENALSTKNFLDIIEENEQTIQNLKEANLKLKNEEISENQLFSNQLESMKLKMEKLQEKYNKAKSCSNNPKDELEIIPILVKEDEESEKHLMKEKILEKFKFERERRLNAEKEAKTCAEKKLQYEIFCTRVLRSTGIGIQFTKNFGAEELIQKFMMNEYL